MGKPIWRRDPPTAKVIPFMARCPGCQRLHPLPHCSDPGQPLVRVRAPKVPTMRGARYINGKYVGHFRQVTKPDGPPG